MPENAVWYDGRVVAGATGQPTLGSFGLHYGYAVFEGLRAFDVGGRASVFALRPHIDRLLASAAALGIPVRYDDATLAAAHHQVLAANGLTEAYLRPIVFFGEGLAGLDTRRHQAHVAILAWPWSSAEPAGGGVSLALSTRRRPAPECFPPHVKAAGGYLVSKLAYNEAVDRGFADSIMLDDRGLVAEATSMNVFAVRGGALLTPTTRACLPGITRHTVIALARDRGIEVRQVDLTVDDLTGADEVFLTSTAAGVRPVLAIEDVTVGTGRPGPVTTSLVDLYQRHVLTHSTPAAAAIGAPAAVQPCGGRS